MLSKTIRTSRVISVRRASNFTQADLPKVNHIPPKYDGPDPVKMLALRKAHVHPSKALLYSNPLILHHGHMQYLYNEKNERYIDCLGGICTISAGHSHPTVVNALKSQADTLWHTSNIYIHPKIVQYTTDLAAKMPGNLKVVFCTNSGGEANDLALVMARLHSGCNDIISLRNAYHGMGPYIMPLTSMNSWKHALPAPGGHLYTIQPDPYRGYFGGKNCRSCSPQALRDCDCAADQCRASDSYVRDVNEVLNNHCQKNKVGGIIIESMQGAGGIHPLPRGYMKRAFEAVRARGGVCIADEVQTGFGRTGEHYWGFERQGATPDIVTMAKGIGNGMPLAAVVTTPEVAASLTKATHFNTFGGNPLSCAVGSAVLKAIDDDKLQENCRVLGKKMLDGFGKMRADFDSVGDARGEGLMSAIELVKNKATMEAVEPADSAKFMDMLKERFVLAGRGGRLVNVIRIQGPMCLNDDDADFVIGAFRDVLENFSPAQ